MKITFISDTHSQHQTLNSELIGGDIIVHCGDIGTGSLKSTKRFLKWFGELPYRHKIFIAGNHDTYFVNNCLPHKYNNIHYLQDSQIVIDGLKFWGSPWVPEFGGTSFGIPRGDKIDEKWQLIPDDTDILITHTPPYSILDWVPVSGNLGCENLLFRVMNLKPKIHAFGHIHYSYGEKVMDCTKFMNCAQMSESYVMTNKPIMFDI